MSVRRALRAIIPLLLVSIALSLGVQHRDQAGALLGIASLSVPRSVPDPMLILRRSLAAMSTVHTVHSVGGKEEREVVISDFTSVGAWRVSGDCRMIGKSTTARFTIRGRQTGRHPARVDREYLVRVPDDSDVSYAPRHWQVWSRPAAGRQAWRPGGTDHNALAATSLCPSLVVAQLGPSLYWPLQNLGPSVVHGHAVWRLHRSFDGQGSGSTFNLAIDQVTLRWVRVELGGWGAGCCHSFHAVFDFSRYNAPLHLPTPGTGV